MVLNPCLQTFDKIELMIFNINLFYIFCIDATKNILYFHVRFVVPFLMPMRKIMK